MGKTSKDLTDLEVVYILEEYSKGSRVIDIARAKGIGTAHVNYVVRKNNLPKRHK